MKQRTKAGGSNRTTQQSVRWMIGLALVCGAIYGSMGNRTRLQLQLAVPTNSKRVGAVSTASSSAQQQVLPSPPKRQRQWSYHLNVSAVVAENILWSQNWKRYTMASCPHMPLQYFTARTESRHSPAELTKWFKDCHGVIWIRVGSPVRGPSNVDTFAEHVLGKNNNNSLITKPFILVTTDGDYKVPSSLPHYQIILDHPFCVAWYTQGYDGTVKHVKLRPIPIGFDLHTGWGGLWSPPEHYHDNLRHMKEIRARGILPRNNRSHEILVPAWAGQNHPDRKISHQALEACNKKGDANQTKNHVHLPRMDINDLWNSYAKYQFGLSPFGNGMDCHRTWEYLFFGVVPIVKTSPLDALYEGLPVIIVEEYSDLCQPDYVERAWKNISHLWPAPDASFTMKWWLNKGVDPETDGLLSDIVTSLPY